jgi:hypothetical protein
LIKYLIAIVLISLVTRADVLRKKQTGEIISIGSGYEENGKIYWTDCEKHRSTLDDASNYIISKGANCKKDHNAINPDQEKNESEHDKANKRLDAGKPD